MRTLIKDALRVGLVVFISLALLMMRDTLQLSHAVPYKYSLVQWEAENFLAKWLHGLGSLLPGNSLDEQEKIGMVMEYFRLGEEEERLERRSRELLLPIHGESPTALADYLEELMLVKEARAEIRNEIEETMEAAVDAAIDEEGLFPGGLIGAFGLHLPPVDFRLAPSPKALIISRRDRIEIIEATLLDPDITVEEMDALERQLLTEEDVSALVAGTGGVATFPSVINARYSLRTTLRIAAHEWLHHYLFFRPLGQTYGSNSDMTAINETVANIFGNEIGDLVYRQYETAARLPVSFNPRILPQTQQDPFDFRREMRETRLTTEELLSEGRIEEAEAYMEERRLFLGENGHYLRKINQAYFAFHGNYADSPASVSPLFEQLSRLRASSPTLGHFIRDVASVSSQEEFLELYETKVGGEKADG